MWPTTCPATARRERFLGAPTVRVDGEDVEPGARARSQFGLTCRLYDTAEGLHGVPRDEWVLDALRRAHARAQVYRRFEAG